MAAPVDQTASTDTPQRSIVPCNFRSAGRLSNESTRYLRTIHDAFARNLTHSLDLFFGAPIEISLAGVEQRDARDFINSSAGSGYFVPFSVSTMQERVLVRVGATLLFPLLDLLLGGPGEPDGQTRELTEIDEELMRSVTELIGVQLERAWRSCQVTVAPGPSVKPGILAQVLTMDERVTLLRLDVTIASVSGELELVLPMGFTNALIRATRTEATQHVTQHAAPVLHMRDRLLQCNLVSSAELSGLYLSVGDLIDLRPGDVLNLHAPIACSLKLKIAEYDLFEITAVRHNNRKAAQLRACCR